MRLTLDLTPETRFERVLLLVARVLLGLAVLCVALLAGMASAQASTIGQPVAAPPPATPAWLTLVLGLAPTLVGLVLGWHLLKHIGAWLAADGAKRGGVFGGLEKSAGVVADDLDDYLTANGQSLKDLADPTKRAAAEAALAAQAKAQASKVVDDALKRAL